MLPFLNVVMARGLQMLAKIEKLEADLPKLLSDGASNHEHEFEYFNRVQLRKGKDRTGGYLPRYIDDPYFKDIRSAIAYQDWKFKLGHTHPDKPADVMDFRINGYTHFNIVAKVSGNQLAMGNKVNFEDSISQKTGGKAWGINPESAKAMWDIYMKPFLLFAIRRKLS